MTLGLILLETEGGAHELPIPPLVIGIIAFGLLVTLLMITLSIGKGRPHS